jgi:hypothetical protein
MVAICDARPGPGKESADVTIRFDNYLTIIVNNYKFGSNGKFLFMAFLLSGA